MRAVTLIGASALLSALTLAGWLSLQPEEELDNLTEQVEELAAQVVNAFESL